MAAGGRAAFARIDVTSTEDLGAMFAAARDRFGGFDILVQQRRHRLR